MSKSTGLPPNIPPQLRAPLDAMKETVEEGAGLRGNPLQRYLKVQDLIDLGYAELIGKRAQQIVSGGNLKPTTPPPNMAVPPAPTGFNVNSGVFHILLDWDPPLLAYGNHAYTEVWRNTADNRANAVMIAQADGFLHPDMDVSFGTTYYYWIRFVSAADVPGPFNAVNGTPGSVKENPQDLLDRLSGAITETELFADLNARIDLIDGPPSLVGSVADRIADEAAARAADISQAYTDLELYADSESTAAINITQLITEFGGNTANALDFTVSEVDSQLAVTTTFQQYDAQFLDIESDLTSKANITYVDQAISDEESARSSQFSQLSASIQAAGGAVNANFEAGDTSWAKEGSWGIVNDPANAHSGSWVASRTISNGSSAAIRNIPQGTAAGLPVNEGDRVFLSGWVKTSAGASATNLGWRIGWRNSSGNEIASSPIYVGALPNTTWTQVRGARTAPAGAAFAVAEGVVIGQTGGTVYADVCHISMMPKDDDLGVIPATVSASVTEVNEAVANAAGASASSIAQLSTQHGTNTSTIQVQQNSIDGLEASYMVKVDINGRVAGYGLSVTGNEYDDQVDSVMLFSVDTFAIGSPGATDLSFIVDNGQVVMDAAYIVNLVVQDADIISIDAAKITGLEAEIVDAAIENLFVEDLQGDVNSTVTSVTTLDRDLPGNDVNIYREILSISIPSQTRPRIPLLFSKAELAASTSGSYSIGFAFFEENVAGVTYTSLSTTDFSSINSDRVFWQVATNDAPTGWDSVSVGDEVGFSINGQLFYAEVSSKQNGSNQGGFFFQLNFAWGVFPGGFDNFFGTTTPLWIRARSGSQRRYEQILSSSQKFFEATANTVAELNDYIMSLPRSSLAQSYLVAVSSSNSGITCESLRIDALVVR